MIDESDNGRELAEAVAGRILQKYPMTRLKTVPSSEGYWFTTAIFTPPNRDGVAITLYANYDWSFDLQVGRFHLFESEAMAGTAEEHVARIVNVISDLADNGLARGRLDKLIGWRDRVAPWR